MADGAPAFELPEFTRSLRGFASVDGVGRPSHDLVFGPLLAARRSAARVSSPEARIAAFDADRLRRALAAAIATLADERAGSDAPLRRALEARLEECAGAAVEALGALAVRATEFRAAQPADRPSAWAAWCHAVQNVFDAVDGFWLAVDVAAPPRTAARPRMLPALVIAAAALALGAGSAGAQRVMVRVDVTAADSLLAAGFDVASVDSRGALVVATPEDRARLELRGFRVTEVIAPRAAARAGAQAATVVYRSFDDPTRGIRRWVDSIAAANPRVSVDTIGRSFEGRPLLVLKVGPAGDSPTRPNAFFVATYHAREWAATETALRLVKWLAAPPGTDARRDSLVQTRDIWIMPVANPDGYQFSFDGDRLWRKTRSLQPGGTTGVDMNRNHSVNWGLDNQGSSPDAATDIYRGPSPASEAETRSIEAFHAAHPPVVSLSYHTYAGLLIYPPGAVYGELPADLSVYRAVAGTHARSAVADRLPGSTRTAYAPGPAWQLYTTNGEYTDFAATRHGTIALTTELSSGYGASGFYGFEFPDNDALLETLFQDNLPFALDLLDAARDPARFASATTGIAVPRLRIESVSPEIRATVPAAAAPTASVAANAPVTFRIDSTAGGKYQRRLVSAAAGRPTAISVAADGVKATFRVLALAGAEPGDASWPSQLVVQDSGFSRAGAWSWLTVNGSLATPVVKVPADADTVSLVYWTLHIGSGFSPNPSGKVELTTDGGASWSEIHRVRGSAPAWYTDGVSVGGVRGKSVAFRFSSQGMPWRLDEVAVVAHGPVNGAVVAEGPRLRPSENPVRAADVRFVWPFGSEPGDLIAYDFSGREVWRRAVVAGATQTWEVANERVANGAYILVARAGRRVERLKLFVARRSP